MSADGWAPIGLKYLRAIPLISGYLGHRSLFRLAIHGGGGGEEHVGAVLAGGLQHVEERIQVVLVIHQRLGHGLADGFVGGEVDHGVDGVAAEQRLDGGRVAEIYLFKGELPAEYGADALVVGFVAIGHVVGDDHVVAGLGELHGHVAPDESGSAGHEYCFLHNLQK